MVGFIKNPSKEEGETTISHPQNIGLSLVQIYNLDKQLVYSDLSPSLKDTVSFAKEIFDSLYHLRKMTFFLRTKYGLLEVFCSTVHHSEDVSRNGLPNGFVIYGKLWDQEYVNVLKKITNCNIDIWLSSTADNHTKETVEIFFNDYKNQRIAHINVAKVYPFLENLQQLNIYLNIFFVVFCLVLFVMIYYTYSSLVISPLRAIEATLNNEKEASIANLVSRNDEFGKIAKLIDSFFIQRNELKRRIGELDQAHRALNHLNTELSEQKHEIVGQNSKLQFLNDEMQAQNEEISAIAEGLHHANKEITDSINYASFIQKAVLAPSYQLSHIFPDHLILYAPKNIVSGDFYWFKEMSSGEKILAVADCTGHGLSGALLSMLGISFLNQITSQLENEPYNAAMILDHLKGFFIKSLHQDTDLEYVQDGMHIALCIFDKECRSMQYATAFHTICLIRENTESGLPELTEYKGNRIPVGIYITDEQFTNHTVELQKGDLIYMYSDGLTDQFGGTHNKKFMPSKVRNILVSIAQLTMSEQKEKIVKEFEAWKGSNEQTDDIIVLGIRVNGRQ